jgi:hypothetical protein
MSGLAFNLHVENKSITTLFHKEGDVANKFNPATFY